MMKNDKLVFAITFLAVIVQSTAIKCYQCKGSDSSKPFQCNEWLSSDIDIVPESCDDVYSAQYCIKHTGRFEGVSLDCYQCSASETKDCSDVMVHMDGIQPKSCDHVFEAEYCIKSTGLDGGIGTKRFCSSLDLGNYCNNVKHPGDILMYRSCVYTCTGDGCNSSARFRISFSLIFLPLLILYRL